MFLSGTLLNAATVLAGGTLGTLLGARVPEHVRDSLMRAIGLFTIAMGLRFTLDSTSLLTMLGAILSGGLIGTLCSLERRLAAAGEAVQRRFGGRGTVADAFVTAAVVFCVGPLTFQGALQNGLTGDASLLAIKSVLDGFTAIALAATLGWGVLLTLPVILIYQGGVSALAAGASGLLSSAQLTEMNAVGGLLVLGVGLKLLRVRDVAVADFLPSLLTAPLIVSVAALVTGR